VFSRLKATFGMHSHLLRVNTSPSPSLPGFFPAGTRSRTVPTPPCHLTGHDLDGVAAFVRDFVAQSLVPHMARVVSLLNEQWGAARRGITGRIFSASKKYFGSSTPASTSALPTMPATGTPGAAPVRPGTAAVMGGLYGLPAASSSTSSIASTATSASSIMAPPPPVTYGLAPPPPSAPGALTDPSLVCVWVPRPAYPLASAETQLRRLGDLALMLGDVRFAHSMYDTVRKDYQHDKAHRHLAGINEVLALCAVLLGDAGTRDAVDAFVEAAVFGYASRVRMPAWAVRTLLIVAEAHMARGNYRDVPGVLNRMVSEVRAHLSAGARPSPNPTHHGRGGQESELRSAALLELTACAFLRSTPAMVRKYAFTLILAGHRYNKAGQVA
jgi:hypothetical protein